MMGGVFELFTDAARRVVLFAHEERRWLGHERIGVEHLLLGLLREREGIAARVLASFGVSYELVRGRVVEVVGLGEAPVSSELLFATAAIQACGGALREVIHRGENYVAPEDLLLVLASGPDSVARRVLVELGADPERIRAMVLELIRLEQDPRPDRALAIRFSQQPPQGGVAREFLERCSGPARETLANAEEACLRLHNRNLRTEHVLLGLLSVTGGVAARVLDSCGIIDAQVRGRVKPGSWPHPENPQGHIPLEVAAKRALQRARRLAEPGNVDTHHILLGLTAVHDGFAAHLLTDLGVFPEGLREVIAQTVEAGVPPENAAQVARARPKHPQEKCVSWGFEEALRLARHEAVMRGSTHVYLDDLVRGVLQVDEGWPRGEHARDRLLEGAWPVAGRLLTEIEPALDRPLDAGDLLLLLASVPGGVVSQALSSLDLDAPALAHALDEARRGGARSKLLWSSGNDKHDVDAAREPATELEKLAERRDEQLNQFAAERIALDQRRDELLDELRSHLQLPAD